MLVRNPRSESGMSAIPFVVSLLFVAGFAIAWYNADQEAKNLRTTAAANVQSSGEWKTKWEASNTRLLEITEVLGFGDAEGKPDKAAMQAALQTSMDKWRERLAIDFTADKYQATGTGGTVEKIQGDKVRVKYIADKDQIVSPTLQAIIPVLEGAASKMQNDVKRYVEKCDAEVKSKAEMDGSAKKALGEKDTAYASLRSEYDQSKRTYEEQIRELRDQVQNKDQALQTVQSEIEQVKAEKEKAVTKLQGDVNQKAAEIQTLVRREKPFVSEGPDGEVVGAGAGVAVINRGKKDMLMPGTVFTVLGRVKGGALVPKGMLKVVVCNDETAECRITDEAAGNPIQGTDLIQSMTYSPGRQLRFALIGEFRKMGRSQAEARLKQLGAGIDTAVSSGTHYLVVGAPGAGEVLEDTDAWKRAKEFGVEMLTEAQLASMTMY